VVPGRLDQGVRGQYHLALLELGCEAYSLTGDGNIGWVRSGTVEGQHVGVGDNVAGFASNAIESTQGPHPDVAYSWYVDYLEWIRDTAHPVLGPIVPSARS
jgi:thiosulfate dehydrogenase (quinone) large subunit